jgi:hypothetical protein
MEFKTKFDVGQKVWFIVYDNTYDFAWCAEGKVKKVTIECLSKEKGCFSEVYQVEYYSKHIEYVLTERGVGNLCSSKEELLKDVRSRVMQYFEPELISETVEK